MHDTEKVQSSNHLKYRTGSIAEEKKPCWKSNAILLKKFGGNNPILHTFENTIIIPPVSIGEGCDIKNSVIGPNVAIGENTTINYSIVKDSIIGSYSNLMRWCLKIL